MSIIFCDSETCGLHGLPVLIQYAYDRQPVQLHNVWRVSVGETVDLIEEFLKHDLVFFNAAFDWFVLSKLYSIFVNLDRDWFPEDHINEIAEAEERARFQNICIKPKGVCDLMLLARKGEYQSLMARDDIRINRVPTPLAHRIIKVLEERVKIDDIYFARGKDPSGPRWKVYDVIREDGTVNPALKTIKLKFRASGSLKNLSRHVFKLAKPVLFRDIECRIYPRELGYAPFAKAVVWKYPELVSEATPWAGAWPDVIRHHILHWSFNIDARDYAARDVDLTRRLFYEYFKSPPFNDVDSQLAIMVACCRWRGYAIDIPYLKKLRAEAFARIKSVPTAPHKVKQYITEILDPVEAMGFTSTRKQVLESMTVDQEWILEDGSLHPAAQRAKDVLEARKALKEIELLDKLILARRFHASFKVTGALSNRMAGDNKLNPQGIKHDKYFRAGFPIADSEWRFLSEMSGVSIEEIKQSGELENLCGGDFKSFEVSIADAVFGDEVLHSELVSGRKIHALMAMELFPKYSYEEVLKSDGRGNDFPEGDMYDKGKKSVFLIIYFGDENTLKKKLGIPLEIGKPALDRFVAKRPRIREFQKRVIQDFGALQQPGGIGTAVEWHDPKPYVESLLGFKRFFTLEHKITKILFELAENPPAEWKGLKIRVQRRIDKVQTAVGAVRSALYGAAFGITSSTVRQAGNHYMQSPGADITKALQANIWQLQPVGVHQFIVRPMNVHDEVLCPTKHGFEDAVDVKVKETIDRFKKYVPLLAIDWFRDMTNWAEKKGKVKTEASLQHETSKDECLQSIA